MIVHHEPGTTRDAIDTEMLYKDKRIVLIDTAGLRKRSHVREDMEYYSISGQFRVSNVVTSVFLSWM